MDHTLRDPDQIQRSLQTEVLGSLPVVKSWRGHLPSTEPGALHRPFFGSSKAPPMPMKRRFATLRDSILLPNASSRPRTLLITSATPREERQPRPSISRWFIASKSEKHSSSMPICGALASIITWALKNDAGLFERRQWRGRVAQSAEDSGRAAVSLGTSRRTTFPARCDGLANAAGPAGGRSQ